MRTLNEHGNVQIPRAVTQRADVLSPTGAVEVDGDQPARLVCQQGVDARRLAPFEMTARLRSDHETKRRSPQSAHFTFGFSHTPGRHSFKQRGAHPVLPGLLVLSQRVANTSDRPRNSDVNSATRPSAVVMSGPPVVASMLAIVRHNSARSRSNSTSRSRARARSFVGVVTRASSRRDRTHYPFDGANGRSVRPGRAQAFRHALRRLADPRCAA
jgi:hypothetical protein